MMIYTINMHIMMIYHVDVLDDISYNKLLQQNLTKTLKPYNKIAEEQQNKRQKISLDLPIEHRSSC